MKTTLIHHSKKLLTLIIACLGIHNHIHQQSHRFLIVKYYVVSYKEIIERIGLFFGNLSATSIMLTGNGIKSLFPLLSVYVLKLNLHSVMHLFNTMKYCWTLSPNMKCNNAPTIMFCSFIASWNSNSFV